MDGAPSSPLGCTHVLHHLLWNWYALQLSKCLHLSWSVIVVVVVFFFEKRPLIPLIGSSPVTVDAYRPAAASAMAANSATRSCFAAAFPLFTTAMFRKLGNNWSLTLAAFLCLAIVPFPYLFYKHGHKCESSPSALRDISLSSFYETDRKGSKFGNKED